MPKLFQNRFGRSKRLFRSAAHQIERAFARLRDARCHAGFERLRAGLFGEFFDFDVNRGRDRRAVDEQFSARVHQQIVAGAGKNLPHRRIIGHDGENDVGFRRHIDKCLAGRAS